MKLNLELVWLKRDLRQHDNEATSAALSSGKRVLLVYFWEDFLNEDPHYSERHRKFICESLADLDLALRPWGSRVALFRGPLIAGLERLRDSCVIHGVHSVMETGLEVTYARDREAAAFFRTNGIPWRQYEQNAVKRGRQDRSLWKEEWLEYMSRPCLPFQPGRGQLLTTAEINLLESDSSPGLKTEAVSNSSLFQRGGRSEGLRTLDSFLEYRHMNYNRDISRPTESRISCSRLSPYIAWGNLSVREIWQRTREAQSGAESVNRLSGFTSRLRWQAHFIQKFEMECEMEFRPVNRGFQRLEKPVNRSLIQAWEEGLTGVPLVDASMRCLRTTGYLNFRMRALLVSFATHLLWQPWQEISKHLAAQFLDFEPGIHYPQIQMQAGETGVNQVRIYNPLKNAHRLDPEANFIKEWLPELRALPNVLALQPGLLTPLEQQFYGFALDRDYPAPVVNMEAQWKLASEQLYRAQGLPEVVQEAKRVLARHTLANRNPWDD